MEIRGSGEEKAKPARHSLPKFSEYPWESKGMLSGNMPELQDEQFITLLDRVENWHFTGKVTEWSFKVALGRNTLEPEPVGSRNKERGEAKACNYLTVYRLIDIKARLMQQEPAGLPTKSGIASAIKFPKELEKLHAWPNVLTAFQKCAIDEGPNSAPAGPENLLDFTMTVDKKTKYLAVATNITLAIVHLRALLEGSLNDGMPDLPDSKEKLSEIFLKMYGSKTSARFNGMFLTKKTKSVQDLRTPLLLATLLTPLALLIPNKLDNMGMNRLFLCELFFALGSARPGVVRRLEDLIWGCLFEVAKNSNSTSADIQSVMNNVLHSDQFKLAAATLETDDAYLTFNQLISAVKVPDSTDARRGSSIAHERSAIAEQQSSDHAGGGADWLHLSSHNAVFWGTELNIEDLFGHDFNTLGQSEGSEHCANNPAAMTCVATLFPGSIVEGGMLAAVGPGGQQGEQNDDPMDDSYLAPFQVKDRQRYRHSPWMENGERQGGAPASASHLPTSNEEMEEDADRNAVFSQFIDPRRIYGGNNDTTIDNDATSDEQPNADKESNQQHSPSGLTESETRHMTSDETSADEQLPSGKPSKADRGTTFHSRNNNGRSTNEGTNEHRAESSQKKNGSRPASTAARSARGSTIVKASQQGGSVALARNGLTADRAKSTESPTFSSQKPTSSGGSSAPNGAKRTRGSDATAGDKVDGAHFQRIDDGIWIEIRPCTLDSTERRKIPSQTEIIAYGPCKEQTQQFQLNVHTPEILQAIEGLAEGVENGFVDGMPLHCHPTEKARSVFSVHSQAEFDQLPDRDVQNILRERHIVIHGGRQRKMTFRQALQTLGGGLERRVHIRDQSLPWSESGHKTVHVGTLGALLDHAKSPTGNALNGLDLPMPQASMSSTPYASDTHALLRTPAKLRTDEKPRWDGGMDFPTGHFRWGQAATSGTFEKLSINSNGLAMFISPQSGSKWWIVCRPIGNIDPSALEEIRVLLDPDFRENLAKHFALEAILLTEDTCLIMRPNTLYAAYTPCSSVVHGGHFISTSTMRDMLAGVFHGLVLNRSIVNPDIPGTNTDNPSAYAVVRRLIDLFHCGLVEGKIAQDDQSQAHIPDLSTFEGLIDLIATCTIGKLLGVVDLRTYGEEMMTPDMQNTWTLHDNTFLPLEDRLANQYARGQCHELLAWADTHYTIVATSQDDTAQERSVFDLQAQLFEHHVRLLQYYKHFADKAGFASIANFNALNLETQLAPVRRKYLPTGWDVTPGEDISEMGKFNWALFDISGHVTLKEEPVYSNRPADDDSTVTRLLELGMTERDALNQQFRGGVKPEKTENPSKKRKRKPHL